MRRILATVLAGFLLLSACSGYQYYAPSGNQPPETPTPVETPTPTPSPAALPNPPLNVRIDYIAVKDAHGKDDLYPDDLEGEVQLLVVVTDGKTNPGEGEVFIPLHGEGDKMTNLEAKQVNRRIFHTSSVGDYLRVSILAWDVDSPTQTLDYLRAVKELGKTVAPEAAVAASAMEVLIQLFPPEDDHIGDYQYTWYPDENWGIGQHEVESGDLLVGFSIWAEQEPPLLPEPILLPDIKIDNVVIPSEVTQSNSGWFYWRYYTNTLTLFNSEPFNVEVEWKAYSSDKGEFDHGTTTVPASATYDISRSYYYENDVGFLTLTYMISHKGRELDSWSGTVKIIPGPYS